MLDTPYIIIPIYRDLTTTRACLASVLRHTADHTLVLINDATPEPEITALLRTLAADHANIHLIENATNLGFVRSINLGLDYDTTRDAILLNSDTIVTARWAEKLRAWATSDPRVATVTPFSNNATICSYPVICRNNALPAGLNADDLNALFEQVHARAHTAPVELPTGVGFCMYVRRPFIDRIGKFNSEVFGQGYGEENDFCRRCTQLNGRHLAALDTFVYHTGEVSFGTAAAACCEMAQNKLQALHPDYAQVVETFLEVDPLAVVRRQADLLRYATWPRHGILLVEHGLGGGTQRHVADLARLWTDQGRHPFILIPTPSGGCTLTSGLQTEEFVLVLEGLDWLAVLLQLLPALHIRHIHFHHTWGFSDDIYELPRASGLPFDVTLHDYYAICPRCNGFPPEAAYYCGFDPQNNCDGCLQAARDETQGTAAFTATGSYTTIAAWRRFQGTFLSQARQVIAPSQAAADIYQIFFQHLPVRVQPHPELGLPVRQRPNVPGNILNVCILGGISPQKGRPLLDQLVAITRARNLPLRWVVIGTTDLEGERQDPDYIITGKYQREQLPELFDRYSINAGLLPALWPETFSYVLSECWILGVPVIVPKIGALAERVTATGAGWIIGSPASAEAITDKLLEIAVSPHDFFARCQKALDFKPFEPAGYLPAITGQANLNMPPPAPLSFDLTLLYLVTKRLYEYGRNNLQYLLALKKNELTLTHNHVINLENSLRENLAAVDFLNKTNKELQTAVQQREAELARMQHDLENRLATVAALQSEIATHLRPRIGDLEDQLYLLRRLRMYWLVGLGRQLRKWFMAWRRYLQA